jgi:hypothetical protein
MEDELVLKKFSLIIAFLQLLNSRVLRPPEVGFSRILSVVPDQTLDWLGS